MTLKITAREAARHLLVRLGLAKVVIGRHEAHGRQVGHLALTDRAEVFDYIYANGVWLHQLADGARSGSGSAQANTHGVQAALPRVLDELGVRSLLDVGCGDFTWFRDVALTIPYTGVDIVESVIADNVARYGNADRTFKVLDAVTDSLPKADAVLCREVLFHLSFADAKKVLANVKRSGCEYLLATTDTATDFNADILTGDFRILNLHRRPFRLPRPVASIADDAVSPGRTISVWRVADLP